MTPPRPVVGILQVDNYEDLNRGLEEGERSVIRTEINNRLAAWVDPAHGCSAGMTGTTTFFWWKPVNSRTSTGGNFPS